MKNSQMQGAQLKWASVIYTSTPDNVKIGKMFARICWVLLTLFRVVTVINRELPDWRGEVTSSLRYRVTRRAGMLKYSRFASRRIRSITWNGNEFNLSNFNRTSWRKERYSALSIKIDTRGLAKKCETLNCKESSQASFNWQMSCHLRKFLHLVL